MYTLETFAFLTYTYITHFGKMSWFQVVAFKDYGHFGTISMYMLPVTPPMLSSSVLPVSILDSYDYSLTYLHTYKKCRMRIDGDDGICLLIFHTGFESMKSIYNE